MMNWQRMVLDGVVMAVFFNVTVLLGFFIFPQSYSVMFPREIKEAAAPFTDKTDIRKMKLFLYALYLFLFVYWAISARLAGTEGFRHLFLTAYIEMSIVSVTDFIILDCWLPPRIKHMIKGAQDCASWQRKQWLMKLAIPEHGLVWPLLMCPLAGLLVAGLGSLIK